MSTILIGVDDSTHSDDAVAFGRRLAGATRGKVVLVCAFPYSDAPSRAANRTYRQALEDRADETLRRMEERLALPPERVERIAAANPSPAHALHDAAEATGADLVIVGHTHHSRAGRVVPGTTAERLLHGAPCPVAIVPDGYREHPATAIQRVGVAYIDTPEGRSALTAAAAVARASRARLEVMSASSHEPGYGRLGLAPDNLHEQVLDYVKAQLAEVVGALRTEQWAESVVLDGDAAEQLVAHSAELDLLVVGSRGYGPLRAVLTGGVSGRVSREARCPVIVVPRGVDAPLGGLFAQPAAATA